MIQWMVQFPSEKYILNKIWLVLNNIGQFPSRQGIQWNKQRYKKDKKIKIEILYRDLFCLHTSHSKKAKGFCWFSVEKNILNWQIIFKTSLLGSSILMTSNVNPKLFLLWLSHFCLYILRTRIWFSLVLILLMTNCSYFPLNSTLYHFL